MAIQLASSLIPRNGQTFFLMEDIYFKGGFQVRPHVAARDSIMNLNRKHGMLVYTQAEGKLWMLDSNLTTWTEFQSGGGGSMGQRQVVVHPVPEPIPTAGSYEFSLSLGKTAIVQDLTVNVPCMIEAHGTPDYSDTNPYTFVAMTNHLTDDGSQILGDGTTIKGRRFAIVSNLEVPATNVIYFRVVNQGIQVINVEISLTTLQLE